MFLNISVNTQFAISPIRNLDIMFYGDTIVEKDWKGWRQKRESMNEGSQQ